MKIKVFPAYLLLTVFSFTAAAQITNPGTATKEGATGHVNTNIGNGVDNGLNKAEGAIKGLFRKKAKAPADSAHKGMATVQPLAVPQASASLTAYQNYDFVPGDHILFADPFTDNQDGEFPSHWELANGQGTTNKTGGYEAFLLTDGNYARVKPRMKTVNYLPAQFTAEVDLYGQPGGYGIIAFFKTAGSANDEDAMVSIGRKEIAYEVPNANYKISANLTPDEAEEAFDGKWHHIALAYNNKQLKVYVDQHRLLTVPDTKIVPANVHFGGIASQEAPIAFRNVTVAAGGGMNILGKKFTDAKIITHGINFDVDKAVILPQSMGTLNEIKAIMTDNRELQFEVGGHTDNTGGTARNYVLSQERAEAVRNQLIKMGIDPGRLIAKGYGDTKPISDNSTPEGKANNRRVEFVKL